MPLCVPELEYSTVPDVGAGAGAGAGPPEEPVTEDEQMKAGVWT